MKIAVTLVGLFPVLLLTGCVCLVPLPPTNNQVYGRVIESSQTRFIVAGQTTRDEVVARLGGEFRDSPRMAALAYSWETPAADIAWWIAAVETGGGGHFERSHWRAFFVKFDAEGWVANTKFVSLSQHRSLDEQLEDWATPKKHGFISSGAHVFNPDTGVPWVFESMQESGQFSAISN
jgi:hypothetical protein